MPHAPAFPVILPSETQSREFDAKLLLAACLARRGHPVIVGSRIEIHNRIHALPRGLYLAKDIAPSSRRMFRIMHRLGFSIAAWDEEALIFTDAATFHARRVDPENLRLIKAFFALGPENRRMLESAPSYAGTPVFETGNPRIDLLGPRCRGIFAPEAAALRERYGAFILVNSNFGKLNHFVASEATRRTADGGFVNMGSGNPEWWAFRMEVFDAMRAMLPALGRAFPDRQIVVRPHPAEGHEAWRAAAEGLPNIHVVHQGAVQPWILASAVAVHNGCTTGLESYLLGHPVIAYHAVTSEKFDDQLPNRASTPVHSPDELTAALRRLFSGEALPEPGAEVRRLAEQRVGPLDGTLAAERIEAVIREHGADWLPPRPPLGRRIGGYAASLCRRLSKEINAFRPNHKNSRRYTAHRFPGLSEAEVAARLAQLGELMGDFDGLRARQRGPNIFEITAPADAAETAPWQRAEAGAV